MATNDVEKRMNLSLDAIIKQKSGKSKRSGAKKTPVKGRGKVKIARLTDQQKSGGGSAAKKKGNAQRRKPDLGVVRKELKKQKGGKKAVSVPVESKGKSGKQGLAARRRGNPIKAEPIRKKGDRGRASGGGSEKRLVDLPRISDLRITIRNERAAPSGYAASNMGAPGFQTAPYPSQAAWPAPGPEAVMQQPAYGYGPRNLQPREAYSQPAPNYPVPRARMNYGVSRTTFGLDPRNARRPYKDFDDPNQNQSYMRMDNGR